MMKNQLWKAIGLLLAAALSGSAARAQSHPRVDCQKVFVTGTQTHEIAWALEGAGLRNNLYRLTCMEPVPKPEDADAILDIEIDPKMAGLGERMRAREESVESGQNYWVTCNSNATGSYCTDSTGYALDTQCDAAGCSSYYGPDPIQVASKALLSWVVRTSAWGYMFSAKGHKELWRYEGDGAWKWDLVKYAECPHKNRFTSGAGCKAPKSLLP